MSENSNQYDKIIDDNEENKDIKYDDNGMPIYDEDEDELELRQLIFEKQKNKNYNNYDFIDKPKEIKQKKNKQKESKTLSLSQFNKIILKKNEENKPKIFVSKRCIEKKQELNTNIKVNKRTFNPRLVPYYFSDNYINNKIIKQSLNNIEDFPLLS
jgi:hypothetical protein